MYDSDFFQVTFSFIFDSINIFIYVPIMFLVLYGLYRKRGLQSVIPTYAYYLANQSETLNEALRCPHCRSQKLIRGQFFTQVGRRNEHRPAFLRFESIEFNNKTKLIIGNNKHPTIYRLKETYFNCCVECGYVFATVDTAKVDEILQIYAKPELLRRLGL